MSQRAESVGAEPNNDHKCYKRWARASSATSWCVQSWCSSVGSTAAVIIAHSDPVLCSQKRKLGRLFNFSIFVRRRERQIFRRRSGMLAAMLAFGV